MHRQPAELVGSGDKQTSLKGALSAPAAAELFHFQIRAREGVQMLRLKTKSLFANAVVLTERALAELKRDGRQPETRIREATSLRKTLQCDWQACTVLEWSAERKHTGDWCARHCLR